MPKLVERFVIFNILFITNRSLAEAKDFSSILCVQTGFGVHPASCLMFTRGPFPGGKALPWRDANHSPTSSVEVGNEYELYLLSLKAPSCRVVGQVLFVTKLKINDVLKRVVEITTASLLPYIATWNAILKTGHTTQKFAVYLVTGCWDVSLIWKMKEHDVSGIRSKKWILDLTFIVEKSQNIIWIKFKSSREK
jgi:hypothetical protein